MLSHLGFMANLPLVDTMHRASLVWCIFCGCQSIPVGQWGQSGQRKVYMPVSPRTIIFQSNPKFDHLASCGFPSNSA